MPKRRTQIPSSPPSPPPGLAACFGEGMVRCLPRPPRGPLLVALSGGADSTALLALALQAGFQVRAVHVDHGIRGLESRRDADHCAALCRSWGVPLRTFRLRLGPGPGCEERAREGRTQALAQAARAWSSRHVLLAHHLGDQAETFLMHACRGAGPGGLAGLRPCARMPRFPGLAWLRPILKASPTELRAWLHSAGVAWREDKSNQDRSLARNRLRLELIPALEALWPGAQTRLAALAGDMALLLEADKSGVEMGLTACRLGPRALSLAGLQGLEPALRLAVLRSAAAALPGLEKGLDRAASARLLALASHGRGACDLLRSWRAETGAGRLSFRKVKPAAPRLR